MVCSSLPEEGTLDGSVFTPAAQDAAWWPWLSGGWWHDAA